MLPLKLLSALELLPEAPAKILDVGIGNGDVAKRFVAFGYSVDAIDIYPYEGELIPGLNFKNVSLFDFTPEVSYDIVIARDVISVTLDPLAALKKVLTFGDTVLFSVFGPDDSRKKLTLLTREDIASVLPQGFYVWHESECREYKRIRNGNQEFWHYFTFVVSKKRPEALIHAPH